MLISVYSTSVFAVPDIEDTQNYNEYSNSEYNQYDYSNRAASISEEYLDYLENPENYDGSIPSMNDLSYLAASYADIAYPIAVNGLMSLIIH